MDKGQSDVGTGGSAVVEHFRPTSGRFTGAVLVAGAVVVVVLCLLDPTSVVPEVGVAAILVGLLGWAVSLRPRVSLVGSFLILRGVFSTTAIPLAAIEEIAIRQLTVVRAGDRRYTCSGLGRSRRSLVKGNQPGTSQVAEPGPPAPSYAEYAEDKIRQRIDDELAGSGIRRSSPEQLELGSGVLRQPAWAEIATVAAAAIALVVVIAL